MLKNPLEVALSIFIFGAYGWPLHDCTKPQAPGRVHRIEMNEGPRKSKANAAQGFWFHWISSRFKPARKTKSWLTSLGCPNNFEHYVAMHPVQFVALQNMNPFRSGCGALQMSVVVSSFTPRGGVTKLIVFLTAMTFYKSGWGGK